MKKNKYEVIVPGGATQVLLHTCCAPCSSAIIECMLQHGIRPTIDYDHTHWLQCVRGLEQEPERGGRCLQCFKMRLRDTAQYAHDHGFTVITTTLASSRWKSLEQINAAGAYAVAPFDDVVWWDQNWRKGGLSERRIAIIKQYGFYNQQYCGCEFSMQRLTKQDNTEAVNSMADKK